MRRINGEQALANRKGNPGRNWNNAASSSDLSDDPRDASRRIYDGFAQVRARYDGPRLDLADPVFAMGSCFAREIETALIGLGGNVVSIDDRIERPEFRDGEGEVRSTFFHRYTPRSMLQEFQRAFDEGPEWPPDALLFRLKKSDIYADFNFAGVDGADYSGAAVRVRREIARDLVRQATTARLVIVTLGLIESWYHKPTGLYANAPTPGALTRHVADFELTLIDVDEAVACLEEIHALLRRHHQDGAFQLVVTVSPVPMSSTFTSQDIVVANAESKAVLRAAAGAFTARRADTHYFPSYEMVTYSAPELAWRPDRVHVNGKLTRHIVKSFMRSYYQLWGSRWSN